MANFSALLSKPADDAKRPVVLPDGTYFGVVKAHELGESTQKKTPFVQFNVELTHAHDDTDTEGNDPAGKKMRSTFYITDESLYRLVDFIKSLGVQTEGRSLGELIPQAVGQTVMLDIVKKPNQAGDDYFNEVKKIVGLAEEDAAEQPAEAEVAEGGRRRRA